jgi:cob(I)alamin adenosyltransferase
MKSTLGTIQVYTGNGKGKTTASLGLAMRALGHGQKVLVIQFMKGSRRYGEVRLARALRGLTLVQSGRRCFVNKRNPDPKDVRLAQAGLARARKVINGRRHDLVILDELNVAVDYGLVSLEAVLDILKNKPREVEVVLTGRNAHPKIIEIADLASEIREIKHHYRAGVKARTGVEF